tara:strand:- start:67497 stop:68435 length:939 start_codon:yes stop_codon:yes gene_type:complete
MASKHNISTYQASNRMAFRTLLLPFALAVLAMGLSLQDHWMLYLSGQLLLSFFLTQCFILLHECGHLNFFKTRRLNQVFGNLFGFLTMIPFYSWQHMHNLHHRWTGWRDKDPTTEKTVEPSKAPLMRVVANIAWYLYIPIFYLAYMLSNYWNISKIKRHLNKSRYNKAKLNIIGYFLAYALLFYFFWDFIVLYLLPAFILSFIWKELIILTQHSHVEIPISEGQEVRPVAYKDQVPFTRSFYTYRWLEEYVLFNFNLHEAHHVYPGLPAYYLSKVDLSLPKEPSYSSWFKQAKSLKAEDYIFRTSKQTGRKF